MAYNATIGAKTPTVAEVRDLTNLLLTKISTEDAKAIKYVSVSGNTVSFWKDENHSGAADFTFDFPAEYFLDQARTVFVQEFEFETGGVSNYPGATDPNLDGKPVMVLAVKDSTGTSVTYSFVDLAALADTGKMDKVSGGTEGNLVKLDGNGNAVDSGKAAADVLTTADVATTSEFNEMLVDVGLMTASAGE